MQRSHWLIVGIVADRNSRCMDRVPAQGGGRSRKSADAARAADRAPAKPTDFR